MEEKEILLKVNNLKQYFKVNKKKNIKAVDDISFDIKKGETFGLVGESGSGKSTTGRAIIRLYNPTDGTIEFDNNIISKKLSNKEKMNLFKNIQMIFQDPFASVNPRLTVEQIIGEGIKNFYPKLSKEEIRQRIINLLEKVGLSKTHLSRYPHEFSGGQLQRIGIARALAVEPKLIIADEAISALDVSIQAQVVNLLKQLQKDYDLTFLFIAHDLSMVKYISDRVGVMYKGKLVEIASSDEIYQNALHPYTKSLLSAIPLPDPDYEKTRQKIYYNYEKEHDYSKEKASYHTVNKDHIIYCSKSELEAYLKK